MTITTADGATRTSAQRNFYTQLTWTKEEHDCLERLVDLVHSQVGGRKSESGMLRQLILAACRAEGIDTTEAEKPRLCLPRGRYVRQLRRANAA